MFHALKVKVGPEPRIRQDVESQSRGIPMCIVGAIGTPLSPEISNFLGLSYGFVPDNRAPAFVERWRGDLSMKLPRGSISLRSV